MLAEIVYAAGSRTDLPETAADLTLEIDDLLRLVDTANMLDSYSSLAGPRHHFDHRPEPL